MSVKSVEKSMESFVSGEKALPKCNEKFMHFFTKWNKFHYIYLFATAECSNNNNNNNDNKY